ncbi:MAG: hypothetical protein H9533_21980 [Rhodobacteraceae bacterium]|nr:hypothetical protein [Paracoccaceae bacterium]
MPAAVLTTILGALVLTYALGDVRREADDRKALAIAAHIADQASAFDTFQTNFIASSAAANPSVLASQFLFVGQSDGTMEHGLALQAPYRRTVTSPGRQITALAMPFPSEPQQLGVFIVDLAEAEELLMPRILAALDARAATESKVWRGDVLPWLRTQNISEATTADFAFFTAPFAGIKPDIIRRNARAGWPDLQLATDLVFATPATLCGASRCAPVNRIDAVTVTATSTTLDALMTDRFTADALTAREIRAQNVTGEALSTGPITTTRATADDVSAARLSVPAAPLSSGYNYAVEVTRLNVTDLSSPLVALETTLSATTSAASRMTTVNTIVGRSATALPTLSLTTLTASLLGTAKATLSTARVQSCTGCP